MNLSEQFHIQGEAWDGRWDRKFSPSKI